MDVADPATVALTARTADVIRALAATSHPLGVRELARIADVSPNRTHQVVDRLTEHGVVLVEQIGSQRVCRLNHDHLATRPLLDIAQLRTRMFDYLRSVIESWDVQPLHASVFGSAARGDGDTESDLDLLVVFHKAIEKHHFDPVEDGSDQRLLRATGNQPSWTTLFLGRFRRLVEDKEPLVAEWREDNVHLTGRRLSAMLKDAQ